MKELNRIKIPKIKETYLLLIIVIGLVSLSLYTTFALFTASTEINNVVNFTATLTTDSNIIEYEMVTIPAGETKIIELNVTNSYETMLYYGAWYEIITPSDTENISIGLYTDENNTPGSGTINSGVTLNLLVGIKNNSDTEAIINVGVASSIDSNLNLSTTRDLITSGWKPIITLTPEQVLERLNLLSSVNEEELTLPITAPATTDEGIYMAEDDLGNSYFFRGAVTNNYVKFGKNSSGSDMYWRIIRINGDGTVRMIYDGTQAWDNGVSNADRHTTTSIKFNNSNNRNAHVGYMYGANFQDTYESEHANDVNSTIKTYLEGELNSNNTGWYYENIIATGYDEYVVDAIYCNDRSLDTTNASYTGIGTITTYYGTYQRLALASNSINPTLKCVNKNDRFTTEAMVGTVEGNDKLKYPVGLITADEVVLAGGKIYSGNTSYYLYTGSNYWTMSPWSFYRSYAIEFYVSSYGTPSSYDVGYTRAARPVITLASNALKYSETSNGTKDYPFTVTGTQTQ